MAATIWKFPLEIKGVQEVQMPEAAQILSCHMQAGYPTLWAICQMDYPLRPRKINIVGTGFGIDSPGRFIGTVLMHGGAFVWHVFEAV